MAWTYTLVFTDTAIGRRNQARLRLGDTDTNRQLLADEEIDHFLATVGDNIVRATLLSARAVLARFSTRPDSQRVGDVSIDWSGILARMRALIEELTAVGAQSASPFAGGTSIADIESRDDDSDAPAPVFHEDLVRDRGNPLVGPTGNQDAEED